MWSDVLGLALLASLNPILLAFILLVISRPRPIQNLLAFWVGALAVNLPLMLVSLGAFHLIPSFSAFAKDMTEADPGSGVQPLTPITGASAWLIAAAMTLHLFVRRRRKAPALVGAQGGSESSVAVQDPDTPRQGPPGASIFRRLLRRGREAWDNGALWVSFVFGVGYIQPPPLILLVGTIIVGSGAAIGTQVFAVVVYVFALLAVFEVALLSYLVAPRKTQAVLEPVHDWAKTHRLEILIGVFVIVGAWQVATGTGAV